MIELSLSPKYVRDWGINEAIRELLQNAIDGKTAGYPMDITYNNQTLIISNSGTNLEINTLLLGQTGKDTDNKYIGKYGEGYKLALLVLIREGYPVTVRTNNQKWIPQFIHSETFNEEVLALDIHPDLTSNNKIEFTIENINESEMLHLRNKHLGLEKALGRFIGETRESEYGTILLEKQYKGKFYVNGLYIQNDSSFEYGYDFKNEYVNLDRDRRAINYYELVDLTSRALANTGDVALISKGIVEDITDLGNADTVLDDISDEFAVNFKKYYFEENNLPEDTFVGTEKMIEISGKEKTHKSNDIIGKIVAQANYETDEYDKIKKAVKKQNDRNYAINAYNKSDFKLLFEWYNGVKSRLSEKRKNEFLNILNNSISLRFSGIDLIKSEIMEGEIE